MIQTRSGRVIKKPDRYVPVEVVEDDFNPEDYDSDESDINSEVEYSDEELDEESDSDNSFLVQDDEDEEVEEETDD